MTENIISGNWKSLCSSDWMWLARLPSKRLLSLKYIHTCNFYIRRLIMVFTYEHFSTFNPFPQSLINYSKFFYNFFYNFLQHLFFHSLSQFLDGSLKMLIPLYFFDCDTVHWGNTQLFPPGITMVFLLAFSKIKIPASFHPVRLITWCK